MNSIWAKIYRYGLAFMRKAMFVWVRTRVPKEELEAMRALPPGPVCYVLEKPGLADAAVLDNELLQLGREPASRGIDAGDLKESRALIHLRSHGRTFLRRNRPPDLSRLGRIFQAVADGQIDDVTVVPVSIYWGRAPDKERSLLKLFFSENWAISGRLRRLFTILVHGRNVLVQFSAPISVSQFLREAPGDLPVRKMARVLRVHFRRQRAATIGPDLSHRRTLVNQILMSQSVRRQIRREVDVNGVARAKAEARARKYAFEIAADYSPPFVQFLSGLLGKLWNRIYEGVEIAHLDSLKQVAGNNEIVYVPCHRSHIDYLLLSYVIYERGMICPHIAAGINLNLPVVGSLLRKGGAFFLRRSFRDNPLYAAVFNKYLSLILAKGLPIEYFVEGGRSRTGRLLSAKPGMLSMTVRGFLRNPSRPLAFVPVFFGYERLMEGKSYISELSGQAKQRETLFGLVKSLKVLRKRFGRVYVNFGEPIPLEELLDQHHARWREHDVQREERPAWLQGMVRDLGDRVLRGINDAAAVNPVNLVATALLSMPRCSMLETELVQFLDLHLGLLRAAPYSPRSTVPEMDGRQVLDYVEQLGLLKRKQHKLGDIMYLQERDAILASYFRNNVAHVFALQSLIACCFLDQTQLERKQVLALLGRIYPYVRGELQLRWQESELQAAASAMIDALARRGLLVLSKSGKILARPAANTPEAIQLSILARTMLQALERYYVTVALLLKHGPGVLTPSGLEELCQLMAQRISFLYQINAPEFFDRSLFRGFIQRLRQHEVINLDEQGRIEFGDNLTRADDDARMILGEHLRHDILQAVHV
ncbi:MAG: glycerol-3-phosphate 1-O-acyltransferase PlsB [Gammaproteobacteria bacterium]